MAKYTSEAGDWIEHEGKLIPVNENNYDYKRLLEDSVEVTPYAPVPEPPVPVEDRVALPQLIAVLKAKGLLTDEDFA